MTNKIPFDIEKWKSGKYEAIDGAGDKVKSLLIHEVDCPLPVAVVFESGDSETFTIDGICLVDTPSIEDLFLTPKKRKVWIGIDTSDYSSPSIDTTLAYSSKQLLLKSIDAADPCHIIELELPEDTK